MVPKALEAIAHGDDPRFFIDDFSKLSSLQGAIRGVDLQPADHCPVFLQVKPGGDVGVVVQARDHDLVARFRVRPRARARCSVRVVMLAPKTISAPSGH